MPPKEAPKKGGKPKVNYALEFHCDLDLRRILDNVGKLRDPAVLEPAAPFLKKVRTELQMIKDVERIDIPVIPLLLADPMPFESCRATLQCLDGYPWLRQIAFLHCRVGDDAVLEIAEFLKAYAPHAEQNPFGIEALELPENEIGPRGASYLTRVLAQNETVKSLVLDFNPLGNDGAGLLGDGLKWNSTLQSLSLQYCQLGPEGGEMVAKYCIRSSSIRELSLRGNPLGPHGVTCIARSLAKNAYLVKLDLADTSFGIDLEAIEALRDGIEGNDSLEAVDLNLNSMVPAGAELLAAMLKTKPKITQLVLFERISDTVFRDVLDTLQANAKLMKKKKKKK